MSSVSYWRSADVAEYPALAADHEVDVAIVGGGMTGASTAFLLKHAGRRVALIERDRCAQLDTGNTTAHLTHVTDKPLSELVSALGRDHAGAVWDAGIAAVEQISRNVGAAAIDCDFAWVPGYYHASIEAQRDERDSLSAEANLVQELGFPAEYVARVPLFDVPGVRFPNQAVFHPLKYVDGLLRRVPGDGSFVFEKSNVERIEEADSGSSRILVHAGRHTIRCGFVVIATDVPLAGLSNLVRATLLQAKLAPYTTYAIGARIPGRRIPAACYWDSSDPYYFLRTAPLNGAQDYVVFGGLDHKTGQVEQTAERYTALERTLERYVPDAKVEHRWSGQVVESHDGLPFIGTTTGNQFVATGFSGNGITFGTVAAMMARDAVCGRSNPWSALFSPDRTALRHGTWNYLRENRDYPYYLLKDRLERRESVPIESLAPGEGRVIRLDGRRVAAYRDAAGRVSLCSPVCPHLGCIVHWNTAESTWDCPCHGSRFRPTGELLAGPAESPLERL